MISRLLEIEKEYKQAFPSWKIEHTGGGIFVLYKDFKGRRANDGQNIMVSMSSDCLLIQQTLVELGKRKFKGPMRQFFGEKDKYGNYITTPLERDYGYINSKMYEEDAERGWYFEYGYETQRIILSLDEKNEIKEEGLLHVVFNNETIEELKKEFKKMINM